VLPSISNAADRKMAAAVKMRRGLRASSVEKLRDAGCGDREIESITGMSPAMVTRYSRFTDQRQLAKAAVLRLEQRKDA